MKNLKLNRFKAKVRHFRMQQAKTESAMISGDVNNYIKDLIKLYKAKTEIPLTLVPISIKR